jgi:hypothetical protein
LHFIAAAIRKASAKKLEYNITTFLTEEDIVFRGDASSLVRFRFPAARKSLCQQLGDSIAARRRILLLHHRHAKKLTIRRNVSPGPGARQRHNDEPDARPTAEQPLRNMMLRNLSVPASGMTKASRPDPGAAALRHLHLPERRRPALTTLISTVTSTHHHDSFEYPSPPKANEGESRVQCPYCLKPLDSAEMGSDTTRAWTHHVDDDIKPYSCLFPECAKALVFFTRRREWKSHMESAHSKDWTRKVHAVIWYCDIDHNPPERFETDLQWRQHMKDLSSHPKKALRQPTKAQLDALAPRKQQVALREPFVCPLCEQIPEKIRPLVESGVGNPQDGYEFLLDHIANHIKSLSLLSLPCLDGFPTAAGAEGESVAMHDSFQNVLKEGSVAQPPSGADFLDGASLLPDLWSSMEQEELTDLLASNATSSLDRDFSDYVPSGRPPDMLNFEWLEALKKWKGDEDIVAEEHTHSDPILALLQAARLKSNENLTESGLSEDAFSDTKDKDNTGRTLLSRAAGNGEGEFVTALLDLDDNDGSTYRTHNILLNPYQRTNITERRGAIDIRCMAKDVVHGYMEDGNGYATLLVYDFQFDPRKRAGRILSVDMEFFYFSDAEKQPEVISIAPKGRMVLARTTQSDSITHGVDTSAGADALGAKLDATWKWEKTINRESTDATRIIGSIWLKNRDYGAPNAASWTILENESAKTGVPAHVTTAVLLRRHDKDKEFQCTFKIRSKVDMASRIRRMFDATRSDDPIFYNPTLPSTNRLRNYDLDNLGNINLQEFGLIGFENS